MHGPDPIPAEATTAADQARRKDHARLLRTTAEALATAGPRDPVAWLHQRANTLDLGRQSL